MNETSKSGYAPVNGLQMYYEVRGTGGTPLVLIHGGGSTIESSFGAIMPLLAAHYRVIALELQAHGRTSDRNAPESFEQDADDVAALLRYLQVDKANFLGFSNGGTTTLQIAIRHPELVNKFIDVAGSYNRSGFVPGFFDFFPTATISALPQPLQQAFLKVNPDPQRMHNMFEKDRQRIMHFPDIADSAIRSITAPALLIAGDKDVVPAEHMLAMSRLLPHSRVAVLPGGHGACLGTIEAGADNGRLTQATALLVQDFLGE